MVELRNGLIIRAEMLEEKAKKERNKEIVEKMLLYAKTLRRLSEKGYSPEYNKYFIKKNPIEILRTIKI